MDAIRLAVGAIWPVVHADRPVVHVDWPVVHTVRPVVETIRPVVETIRLVIDTVRAVTGASCPVKYTSRLIVAAFSPVILAPLPHKFADGPMV